MGALLQTTKFDLEPQRVKELVEGGEAQLVDVREPYEWEAGRIAGRGAHRARAARRARGGDRQGDAGHLPVPDGKPLRPRHAGVPGNAGYDAYNMDGGILAWAEAGLPLEPEDGEVAPH